MEAAHPYQHRQSRNPDLAAFVDECRQGGVSEAEIETMEKRGMALGINALHPVTGEPVPIFAANFVLMGYGTGAIMSVPAHDQRDWEFASKYGIEIRQVVAPRDGSEVDLEAGAFVDKDGVSCNSGPIDGMDFKSAFVKVAEDLEARGKGQRTINYRLRDWGVSRQRYWGAPIPVINCADCGALPVPEQDLPVVLPEDVEFDGTGSPIKKMATFIECRCPTCGGAAERETEEETGLRLADAELLGRLHDVAAAGRPTTIDRSCSA